MPRYFFTVRDEWGEAADHEGLELPDLAAARDHAVAGARSLMSDSIRSGTLNLGAWIDIRDGDGSTLARLNFRDAISLLEE